MILRFANMQWNAQRPTHGTRRLPVLMALHMPARPSTAELRERAERKDVLVALKSGDEFHELELDLPHN